MTTIDTLLDPIRERDARLLATEAELRSQIDALITTIADRDTALSQTQTERDAQAAEAVKLQALVDRWIAALNDLLPAPRWLGPDIVVPSGEVGSSIEPFSIADRFSGTALVFVDNDDSDSVLLSSTGVVSGTRPRADEQGKGATLVVRAVDAFGRYAEAPAVSVIGTAAVVTPPPDPDPDPQPVAAAESYRVWPNHIVKLGPKATSFNIGMALRWKNLNGDWLDRDGVEQGPKPWFTFNVPVNSAGWQTFDITELAQRWHAGENRGLMMSVPGGSASAWVTWAGTFSVNPPELVLTLEDGNTATLKGDLAGYILTSPTRSTAPSAMDCGQEIKLTRQMRHLLHFAGLKALGAIAKAELRLFAKASDDVYPLAIEVMETDAPPLLIGAAGLPVELGLAAEVGEANLPGHPSIIAAGDYREENWNATPGKHPGGNNYVLSKLARPAKLFNNVTMTEAQYRKTRVYEDPDQPGHHIMRTCIVGDSYDEAGSLIPGNVGGGAFCHDFHGVTPEFTPDPATRHGNVFVRVELFLEPESFWSNLYAFKFSPVGFSMRYGLGNERQGWNQEGGSLYSFGNGQTKSDGKRYFDTRYNKWCYKGHSNRGHTIGWPHRTLNYYPGMIPVGCAPSFLGPHDQVWDEGIYGTEQCLRIGRHVMPTGRWFTIESQIKINTVDMSAPDELGNGVARNDGEIRFWLDGAMVGERTGLAFFCHPDMAVVGNWQMGHHGGNTPANHDIGWHVRNFAMGTRYIGPRV